MKIAETHARYGTTAMVPTTFIRNPDPKEYMDVISHSNAIVRWSAAPELPGAIAFAQYLQSKKILPALAHTDSVYEEVIEAFENGYTLATHLYSAMSGITRKNAPVELVAMTHFVLLRKFP